MMIIYMKNSNKKKNTIIFIMIKISKKAMVGAIIARYFDFLSSPSVQRK